MKHLLGLLNIYDVPKEKWGDIAQRWQDRQGEFFIFNDKYPLLADIKA